MRAAPGDPRVILEAFKPGTAPPDAFAMTDPDGQPIAVPPEVGRAAANGRGLY